MSRSPSREIVSLSFFPSSRRKLGKAVPERRGYLPLPTIPAVPIPRCPCRALPFFRRVAAGTGKHFPGNKRSEFCFGPQASSSRDGNLRQFVFARALSFPRFRSCSHAVAAALRLPLLAGDTSSCKRGFGQSLSLLPVQAVQARGPRVVIGEREAAGQELGRQPGVVVSPHRRPGALFAPVRVGSPERHNAARVTARVTCLCLYARNQLQMLVFGRQRNRKGEYFDQIW